MCRFAHAVLLADGLYVLQLRDNKRGIAAPGMWALFGGGVEDGEQERDALVREIREELCMTVDDCTPLWVVEGSTCVPNETGHYAFFVADITSQWGQHRLMEGQAVERFSYETLSVLPMYPVMREALARHHRSGLKR